MSNSSDSCCDEGVIECSLNNRDFLFSRYITISIRKFERTKRLSTLSSILGFSSRSHHIIETITRYGKKHPFVTIRRKDFSLYSVQPTMPADKPIDLKITWDYPLLIIALYYYLNWALQNRLATADVAKSYLKIKKTYPLKLAFARLRRKDPWFKTIKLKDLAVNTVLKKVLRKIEKTEDCKTGMAWLSASQL